MSSVLTFNLASFQKTIHCPARSPLNQDVLIRLISVDGDECSQRHIDAIRRLATGEVALRGDNHVLPVLDQIKIGTMLFAVLPLMTPSDLLPWFHDYYEVFDFVTQVLQVRIGCHKWPRAII